MKKTLLLFALLAGSLQLSAQTVLKGSSFIDLDVSSSIYNFNSNLDDASESANGGVLGITSGGYFSYHFGLSEAFTIGLEASSQDLPDVTDSAGTFHGTLGDINIITNYHYRNGKTKGKGSLYVGTTLGLSAMNLGYSDSAEVESNLRAACLSFGVQTGGRYFFNKWLGMNFKIGFVHKPFAVTDFSTDDVPSDTFEGQKLEDINLNMTQFNFSAGLSIRFGGKKDAQ